MARAKTLVAVFLAALFLLLPISQAQTVQITPENSVVNPDNAEPADRWMGIDFDHWGKELDRVTDIVQNATSWTKLFDVENMSALIAPFTSGLRAITAGIDTVIGLIAAGGSISGYLDIALNILNAFYTTLASAAVGILGVLPSGIVALLSGGVAILNTVGTLFVAALQAIGFTIEGIVGLTAIGGIISGLMSLVSLFLNVLNFAYTSGVAGIAVVALLLVVLSFVGLAVLAGAIVVLAAGEVVLFLLVSILLVISAGLFLFTLGIGSFIIGLIITILIFLAFIGFLVMGILEVVMKVMTTLMNTVSVPTSVFTAIPSWLSLLFCNFPASCLSPTLSFCGVILSNCYVISTILQTIIGFIIAPLGTIFLFFFILVSSIFLFVFLGTFLGLIYGILFFFVLGFLWMPIIGAIVGLLIGIVLGLILGVIIALIFLILSALILILGMLTYSILLPLVILTFSFGLSGCLSLTNICGIGADAITGFAGLIITGITLMLLRVGIDLMQTTLISEVVSVLVLFLQKLQEISFLTKIAAYPLEVCVGITMLCAAICMFALNILLYPFNFVWQFVDMCLKGCYGVICKPFIRPLGWS